MNNNKDSRRRSSSRSSDESDPYSPITSPEPSQSPEPCQSPVLPNGLPTRESINQMIESSVQFSNSDPLGHIQPSIETDALSEQQPAQESAQQQFEQHQQSHDAYILERVRTQKDTQEFIRQSLSRLEDAHLASAHNTGAINADVSLNLNSQTGFDTERSRPRLIRRILPRLLPRGNPGERGGDQNQGQVQAQAQGQSPDQHRLEQRLNRRRLRREQRRRDQHQQPPQRESRKHPSFHGLVAYFRLRLSPLVSITTGLRHPEFPKSLLSFKLLTEQQLDSIAQHYHQAYPFTAHSFRYPHPVKPWCAANGYFLDFEVGIETKRRRFGRFIGLRGCESPVKENTVDNSSWTDRVRVKIENEWEREFKRIGRRDWHLLST